MSKRNTNPYKKDSDESPLLLRSVIAYIDVLGYKDLIESDCSQYNLKFYHNALNWAYESLEPFSKYATANNIEHHDLKNKYEVRGFFDNIVIGYPIEEDNTEAALEKVLSSLAHVQLRMIFDGHFLRGAISVGELYLDDAIVFGKGFLEAQKAEKNASNPRIILATSAKQYINKHSDQYQSRYLLKDTDNQIFLNYLEDEDIIAAAPDAPFYSTNLLRHRDITEKHMMENNENPKILSKYLWVANYHNYHCKKYQRDDCYKINLSGFQISSIE